MKTDDPEIAALLGFDPEPRGAPLDNGEIVTTDALANLLGLTDRHVQTLTRQGVLKLVRKGRYHRGDSVRAYCADLRRKASGRGSSAPEYTAAKTRAAQAQADKLELANAAARRELLPAGEVEREWAGMIHAARAELLAVPSRIAARLGHLSRRDIESIDSEIHDALTVLGTDHADR